MRKRISAGLGLVFVFMLVFSFALALVPATSEAGLGGCCYFSQWCNGELQEHVRGHVVHVVHSADICVADGSNICDALCAQE